MPTNVSLKACPLLLPNKVPSAKDSHIALHIGIASGPDAIEGSLEPASKRGAVVASDYVIYMGSVPIQDHQSQRKLLQEP